MRKLAMRLAVTTLLLLALATPSAFGAETLGIQDVDTSKYPTVSMKMTLPASMVGASTVTPQVSVSENGEAIGDVKVSTIEGGREPAYVVLVIDASGSMKGGPIADARAAAQRFVAAMGSDARIAVVSFADNPKTVTGFTKDHGVLSRAVSSIQAGGETAVYDGLVTAARLMPRLASSRRSIVLLSDGTDTVSSTSLQAAMDTVKGRAIPVYAVALRSKDFNPKALAIIAQGSGGRLVPVEQSKQLSGLFEGIARELRDVWTVSYTSRQSQTKDVNLDVKAAIGEKSASAQMVYANPKFATLAAPEALRVPQVKDNPAALMGAVVLAFVAVALLIVAVALLVVRTRSGLDHLKYYDQLRAEVDRDQHADPESVRAKVVDAVGYVAGKRGFTGLLRSKLEAAGLPLRPAEYMTLHILSVIVVGFLVQLLSGRALFSVLAIVTVTAVPILVLNIAVDKRRAKFDEQLPDVLNMLSSSLRGGWGIQQAIDLVAQEAGPPAAVEFRRVQTEARLGIPLDDALQRAADRVQSEDFQAAVTAIAIQREVGGNLAEVLDIVAKTIRDRGALRRQISALTAEGRLSTYILIALPIFEAFLLVTVNPQYMEPFTTTTAGIVAALGAVFLLVVGTVWLFRVTRIEV